MNCCQCQGIEKIFDESYVAKELSHYRKKGPARTTRLLIEALKKNELQGLTLLDIGGGVGAIQHALLAAGLGQTTGVDASAAYIHAAESEARRLGFSERSTQQHGNFVDLAESLDPADIVTLDRVICCYDDMEKLVGLSSAKARRSYGLVYPRDTWWVRLALGIQNSFFRLLGNPFRTYRHPSAKVDAIIKARGFKQSFYRQTLIWQIVIYAH